MNTINLNQKLNLIQNHWDPKIVGELNGQHVKLAKLKGEFVRHCHETEDEMFLVLEGKLEMEFDDKTVIIDKGEFIIVPKGVYHKPIAKEEVHVMLFEPAETLNTGNVTNELTKKNLEKI